MQRSRRLFLDGLNNQACQFLGAFSAFNKGIVYGKADVQFLLAVLAYQIDFLIHVGGIAVEGYYYRLAVALQTLYVLVQVFKSLDEAFAVGLLNAVRATPPCIFSPAWWLR